MVSASSASSQPSYLRYPHWPSVGRFVDGVKALQPLLLLLFGSVAKGDFTQHSDADVLAVFAAPTDWLAVYSYSDGRVQPVVKTLLGQ